MRCVSQGLGEGASSGFPGGEEGEFLRLGIIGSWRIIFFKSRAPIILILKETGIYSVGRVEH